MSDVFTETTTTGWLSRLGSSFKGIIVGLLLFLISFGILYWNEGTVDVSNIAKNAVEIGSSSVASRDLNGKLVAVSGNVTTDDVIGDVYLKEGSYLQLTRNVEMYAWVEHSSSSSKKNLGGSETTTKTYTYSKEWTSSPSSSSSFKVPDGHQNPPMAVKGATLTASSAKLGVYDLDLGQLSLVGSGDITLNDENVILGKGDGAVKDVKKGVVKDDSGSTTTSTFATANDLSVTTTTTTATTSDSTVDENKVVEKVAYAPYLVGNEIYIGKGEMTAPVVGDLKISYSGILSPLEGVSVFGKLDVNDKKIVPFYGEKNAKLYRVFVGGKDGAVATLHGEHTMFTWLMRLLGFLMMWIGLSMILSPISVILDVVPVFGAISRTGVSIVTFVIALILSVVTIVVSMILHSLIALIVIVLALVVGGYFYFNKQKGKIGDGKKVVEGDVKK